MRGGAMTEMTVEVVVVDALMVPEDEVGIDVAIEEATIVAEVTGGVKNEAKNY
jgi:hypothetical protein